MNFAADLDGNPFSQGTEGSGVFPGYICPDCIFQKGEYYRRSKKIE
jgi:hypothetical protein